LFFILNYFISIVPLSTVKETSFCPRVHTLLNLKLFFI